MDIEKMKLKILEKVSKEIKDHVDHLFDQTSSIKTDYDIETVAKQYLSSRGKSLDLVRSKSLSREVVEAKRDITFIYYCLTCPFFRELGIEANFPKKQKKELSAFIETKRISLNKYLVSAKHYYKIYEDYRTQINAEIMKHL